MGVCGKQSKLKESGLRKFPGLMPLMTETSQAGQTLSARQPLSARQHQCRKYVVKGTAGAGRNQGQCLDGDSSYLLLIHLLFSLRVIVKTFLFDVSISASELHA